MGDSSAELWIWVVLLAGLMGVGGYVLGRLRRLSASGRASSQDWLSQFREMHAQGLVSDEEFRSIKTTLLPQIQEEINQQVKKDKPTE